MLNIAWRKGSASENADYFLTADYYLDEGQDVAWHGNYKHLLGLDKVTAENLKQVLGNRNPLGGKMTPRDVPGHRIIKPKEESRVERVKLTRLKFRD